ncbi:MULTISPECIES: ArsR/SmtB family transcription factor [Actinoalloteichus]|uniref:Transcriptional regulator, ArsR family n=1 Tax=Actinoalloteichus fjordicus TaxID=1612552 RepID=A0AAC9LHX6_9PSEU|nr:MULTISPECIES: metalloregulator ArsR/SmtB family transcription factor [Actinoalloteichus]APU16690.1 transcriptional regulator, ArsR family [Actinoalloteichus fjordicus]APU22756.1 transcriptional regulator, ArsR family [Actinoalloteichus sp. GBA129-24]
MTAKDALSLIFAALADPTRREILTRLSRGPATVGEVAEPFAMSAPAISQHLKVLEGAGLVERTTSAQWRTLTFRRQQLDTASEWVERHRREWGERFTLLDEHLAVMKEEKNNG